MADEQNNEGGQQGQDGQQGDDAAPQDSIVGTATGDPQQAAQGDQQGQPQGQPPEAPAPAAPVNGYEEFKLPDGMQMDTARLEQFTAVAKAGNMSQQDAQALVDMGAQVAQQAIDANVAEGQKQVKEWLEASRSLPEIGGEKFQDTVMTIGRVMDRFASPELRTWLGETGFGNHPELVKFVHSIGQLISEDTYVPGQGAGGQPVDPAQVLYGGTDYTK